MSFSHCLCLHGTIVCSSLLGLDTFHPFSCLKLVFFFFWLHTQTISDGLGKQLWSVLWSGFSREVKLKLLSFHFTHLFNFISILTYFSFHSLYPSFISSIYVFKITFYIFIYSLNYTLIHTFFKFTTYFQLILFSSFYFI